MYIEIILKYVTALSHTYPMTKLPQYKNQTYVSFIVRAIDSNQNCNLQYNHDKNHSIVII